MRNLLERTYFCHTCGFEVTESHRETHPIVLVPIAQIPWYARREWTDEHNGPEDGAHFWDEE